MGSGMFKTAFCWSFGANLRMVDPMTTRMSPFSLMESAPGPLTVVDGVRYLYFGGTSYLGLAAHPEVIEAGCAALLALSTLFWALLPVPAAD